MANWHILDGNIYVSKSGNDITGTGSMSTPYKTIQKGLDSFTLNGVYNGAAAQKLVVGAGLYEESLSGGPTYANDVVADGIVVLEGTNLGATSALGFYSFFHRLVGFTLQNYSVPTQLYSYKGLLNCTVKNMDFYFNPNSGNQYCIGCFFYNVSLYFGIYGMEAIHNNTFLSCSVNYGYSNKSHINNLYLECTTAAPHSGGIGKLNDYNNFFNSAGLPSGYFQGYSTLAAFNAAFGYSAYPPETRNGNSTFVDPLVNGVTSDDVTLSSISPLVFGGSDGGKIGAFSSAKSYDGLISELTVGGGAIHTNVTVDGSGNFILTTPGTGTIESADIDLGFVQDLQRIILLADQNLDNNTVDYNTGDSNPNRPTFRMKYAATSGALAAAPYKVFEWNAAPAVDIGGNGNGDSAFDPTTASVVNAQWVKVEVTLRNNGVAA